MFNKHTYTFNSNKESGKNQPVEDEAIQSFYSNSANVKLYVDTLLNKPSYDQQLTNSDLQRLKEAFNRAHEIRIFEEEWQTKRNFFYWTVSLLLITSWGLMYRGFIMDSFGMIDSNAMFYIVVISLLGLVFTLVSSLSFDASLYWRKFIDYHIDNLEPFFSGRLLFLNSKARMYSINNNRLTELIYLVPVLFWSVSLAYSFSIFIFDAFDRIGYVTFATFIISILLITGFIFIRLKASGYKK